MIWCLSPECFDNQYAYNYVKEKYQENVFMLRLLSNLKNPEMCNSLYTCNALTKVHEPSNLHPLRFAQCNCNIYVLCTVRHETH